MCPVPAPRILFDKSLSAYFIRIGATEVIVGGIASLFQWEMLSFTLMGAIFLVGGVLARLRSASRRQPPPAKLTH